MRTYIKFHLLFPCSFPGRLLWLAHADGPEACRKLQDSCRCQHFRDLEANMRVLSYYFGEEVRMQEREASQHLVRTRESETLYVDVFFFHALQMGSPCLPTQCLAKSKNLFFQVLQIRNTMRGQVHEHLLPCFANGWGDFAP